MFLQLTSHETAVQLVDEGLQGRLVTQILETQKELGDSKQHSTFNPEPQMKKPDIVSSSLNTYYETYNIVLLV